MRKQNAQAADRKRVLAAIRAEQKYVDAEEALDAANRETAKTHSSMVQGKDLKGLRELKKVFRELKPSYPESKAFHTCWLALQDRIDDYTSGRMDKEEKIAPDPTPGKMEDQGQGAKAGRPSRKVHHIGSRAM